MKFTIAVVLALAVSAQAGILPLTYSLGSSPWVSPLGLTSPLSLAASPLSFGSHLAYGSPLAYTAHSVPLTTVHIAPTHLVPEIIPVAAEGTYTAANRGAVHVAPLPGHILSHASVNLEPAPGTF